MNPKIVRVRLVATIRGQLHFVALMCVLKYIDKAQHACWHVIELGSDVPPSIPATYQRTNSLTINERIFGAELMSRQSATIIVEAIASNHPDTIDTYIQELLCNTYTIAFDGRVSIDNYKEIS